MTKDTSLSLLRALLTVVGSYVLGHNLFGPVLDASAWQEIAGAVMALGAAIWGIADKTANIEGLQSAIRSLVTIVGGFMVASGKLSGQTLNSILGLITIITPAIQSYTSRVKVKQLDNGALTTNANGKVQAAPPQIK